MTKNKKNQQNDTTNSPKAVSNSKKTNKNHSKTKNITKSKKRSNDNVESEWRTYKKEKPIPRKKQTPESNQQLSNNTSADSSTNKSRSKNRNKKKSKLKKLSPQALKDRLHTQFTLNPKKRYTAKQLMQKLKLANNRDSVQLALKELTSQKAITVLKDGLFKLQKPMKNPNNKADNKDYKNFEGKVDMTRSGTAFILVEELDADIFVGSKNLGGALDGDTVKVRAKLRSGKGKLNGKVIEVIKRAQSKFIGTLFKYKNESYVEIYQKGAAFRVDIDRNEVKEIEHGSKVKVEVSSWGKPTGRMYRGDHVEDLSYKGVNDIAMTEILYNNGFAEEFPDDVNAEANKLKMVIDEKELAKRRDFRQILTMTIDPETAKDFDDAISYEELEDGKFELGVHIADVTHFLKPNTKLDDEAFERSTSVYLVDRVAPMLPEVLSNDLCSLNPHEDKYCFSASFIFDKNFKIVDRWIGKTIIHSDRRFSYEEAQERIESGQGEYAKEIQFLNKLAHHLRNIRYKEGSISFETEELRFLLDEFGKPIDVYVKDRKDAHLMIEDFMLLANKEVAMFIDKKAKGQEIPFVYRVHDKPDPDKLKEFGKFAAESGLKMNFDTPAQVAESFNKLADAAKENDALKILEPLAIRTMAKAVYTTDNIGHYGLGFDFYAHFTSPIRRYADVLVHRVLYDNLSKVTRYDKGVLEQQALHISAQERKAVDSERESIKYKQVEWAQEHIGGSFDAYISGMIDRGLFVTVENSLVEGMVTFDQFDEPFTVESRLKAIGKRSGVELKMGDKLKVIITSANIDKRQIELSLDTEE